MYKCKYCGKEFEKKQQLAGHVIWCKENPNKTGKSNFNNIQRKQDIIQDNLFCKYCGKQCKNKNSLVQHEIRCKENPDRLINKGNYSGFYGYNKRIKDSEITVWNKGLTKETHPSIKKQGETYTERVKQGLITSTGGYRENAVKGCYKYGYYNGIRCDSSWELAFVVYCVENNIPIKRNTQRFEYIVDNKRHYFIPDFIINDNEIVEIKGLQDINWKIKQTLFPNIKFLFKKDIQQYITYVKNKYGNKFYKKLYQ